MTVQRLRPLRIEFPFGGPVPVHSLHPCVWQPPLDLPHGVIEHLPPRLPDPPEILYDDAQLDALVLDAVQSVNQSNSEK